MQELLLITGITASLIMTSLLSYKCGHSDGWFDHLEQMIDNAESFNNKNTKQ